MCVRLSTPVGYHGISNVFVSTFIITFRDQVFFINDNSEFFSMDIKQLK